MALKLRIRQMTRRTRCHVPGCKNRNALKISRRDDVNGNPLFLCPDCIRDVSAAYQAQEAEKRAQEAEISDEIEELTAETVDEKAETAEAPAQEAEISDEKPKKPRGARSKAE